MSKDNDRLISTVGIAAATAGNHATLATIKITLSSMRWMLGIVLTGFTAAASCITIAALKLSYHGTLYIASATGGKMYAYFHPAPKPPMIEERKFDGNLCDWDDAAEPTSKR